MASINITHSDPNGLLSAVPLLDATIRAAANYLDQFIVFKGTLDIAVIVETTSTGRFAGSGDFSYAGMRDGRQTWEPSMAAESRNGVDPDPQDADFKIFIDPQSSYLAGMWWDPNVASGLAANPPDGKTDGFSVVLHELLHGMGFNGWRDRTTGALPGNDQSVWDAGITIDGGEAVFAGAATVALLGMPVEVMLGGTQGIAHLGRGPSVDDSEMPWLVRSNMNGYYYAYGERYLLGRLELAILQDLGYTLESNVAVVDVVNRWDDETSELYLVGYNAAEQLVGDVLADRIEGRGGNDVLSGMDGDDHLEGGAGNDTLYGGAGDDIAVYSRRRADYAIAATGAGLSISGPDGSDTLHDVERARFSDQTVLLSGFDVAHPPTGALVVSGMPQQGRTLTASTESIADANGLGSFAYRWQASANGSDWTDIAGATAPTLRLGQPQVGLQLRAIVGYVDGRGDAESVTSAATAAVTNVNDAPTGSVRIAGTVREGSVLTATQTIADADGLGAIALRWQASLDGSPWADIAGATSATFTPGEAEIGSRLRVVASYVDAFGAAETVASNPSAAVSGVNHPPSGAVTVRGPAHVGAVLGVDSAALVDADGIGGLTFQWQSSDDGTRWIDIAGARAESFKPSSAFVGAQLRVVVTYVDGRGYRESVTSEPTATLLAVIDGTSAANVMQGSRAAERLNGLGGDDRITGAGGDDVIDGGSGIDTAVYALQRASYALQRDGATTIVHATSGTEGRDALTQVERLRFADAAVALDLDGRAGTVARLLGAVFGASAVRDAAIVGAGLALLDGGTSELALAQLAIDVRLGAGASHAEVVATLWSNVVGTPIGAAELALFTSALADGVFTKASLTLAAAQTDAAAARIDLVGLADSGLDYLAG